MSAKHQPWPDAACYDIGPQCRLFFYLFGEWGIREFLDEPFKDLIGEYIDNLDHAANDKFITSTKKDELKNDELPELKVRFTHSDSNVKGDSSKALVSKSWKKKKKKHEEIHEEALECKKRGCIVLFNHTTDDSEKDMERLFDYAVYKGRDAAGNPKDWTFFETLGHWKISDLLTKRYQHLDDHEKIFIDAAKRYGLFRINFNRFDATEDPTGGGLVVPVCSNPRATGNGRCFDTSTNGCRSAFMSYFCDGSALSDPCPP